MIHPFIQKQVTKILRQTITVWGASDSEQTLVRSMISLLAGRTDQLWATGDDASCGLVLAGRNASASPHTTLPAETGPRVMAELLSPDDVEVATAVLHIRRPIRVMPLIELLNEAGKRLAKQASNAPQFVRTQAIAVPVPAALAAPAPARDVAPAASAATAHLALAYALRQVRMNGKTSGPTSLVDQSGHSVAVVHVGPGTVMAALPLIELAKSLAQTFGDSRPISSTSRAIAGLNDVPPQSLDALCWTVGATLADAVGLAPWLKSDVVYRLHGWPDFGAIGADRFGMRLSPAMLADPMSPIQLSEKTKISLRDVTSFFNSVSVSGLLSEVVAPAPRAAPAPPAASAPAAPRRSMFALLRSKLGLS